MNKNELVALGKERSRKSVEQNHRRVVLQQIEHTTTYASSFSNHYSESDLASKAQENLEFNELSFLKREFSRVEAELKFKDSEIKILKNVIAGIMKTADLTVSPSLQKAVNYQRSFRINEPMLEDNRSHEEESQKKLEEEILSKSARIKLLEAQNKNLEDGIQQSTRTLEQKSTEIKNLLIAISVLENDKTHSEKQISSLTESLHSTQADLANFKKLHFQDSQSIDFLKVERDSLLTTNKGLAAMQETLDKLNNENARLSEEIDRLRQQISDRASQADHNNEDTQMTALLAVSNSKMRSLSDELDKANALNSNLANKINPLESLVATLRAENVNFLQQYNTVSTELEYLKEVCSKPRVVDRVEKESQTIDMIPSTTSSEALSESQIKGITQRYLELQRTQHATQQRLEHQIKANTAIKRLMIDSTLGRGISEKSALELYNDALLEIGELKVEIQEYRFKYEELEHVVENALISKGFGMGTEPKEPEQSNQSSPVIKKEIEQVIVSSNIKRADYFITCKACNREPLIDV